MTEKKKLSDDELMDVSGGLLFNSTGLSESVPEKPWEYLNDYDGSIIARFQSKNEAYDFVRRVYSKPDYQTLMEVDYCTVQRLRNNPRKK